jgi:hypothetical protein
VKSIVAEGVRKARLDEERELTPIGRVRLALRTGETSLALFMNANGLTRREALERLEQNKHKGRRPSCMSRKPR